MPAQKRHESKQDYATPDDFMDASKARLGIPEFIFDFAANKRNAKAARFWSARDNSLDPRRDWFAATYPSNGWAWLNPPFKDIGPWAKRCLEYMRAGGKIAFLVPASVGSDWFRDYVDGNARVLFCNGRLAFMKGQPRNLYPKDCVLCLFDAGTPAGYEVWDWRGEVERRKAAA